MFGIIDRVLAAAVVLGACNVAFGDWSAGKRIVSDDEELMRFALDLHGGVNLYAMVPAAGDGGVRSVHLVANADLGSGHWLYFAQEACRWDRGEREWADIVIGDRMAVSIPSPSWAEDEADADAQAGAPNALDAQLLSVASSTQLMAAFAADPEARSAILPSQQRLNAETGFCAPVADEGDNAAVGNMVLVAQMDEGSRAVDVTQAASSLHRKAALQALSGTMAVADLVDPDGAAIGRASFEQTPSGVLMDVSVAGLEPGAHGIHLHSVGACEPTFGAAKGHINPHGAKHGLRHPEGPDNGDLPLLHVGADGSARAEFYTTRVSLSGDAAGDPPGLLDEDGSTVVIHANPDDHLTQPIGGAGGRVGCGVIEAM